MSQRRCGRCDDGMLIRAIAMAEKVRPHPRQGKQDYVGQAGILRRNIDPVKAVAAAVAILAVLSVMSAFVQHHNNQMIELKMKMRSSEYEWKRRASELEGRYKRNAYKLDKWKAEQSHSIAKRATGRAEGGDIVQEAGNSKPTGGSVYIRWGRNDCPQQGPSRMIYNGLGAGSHQGHTGGGAANICLHLNTSYDANRYKDGNQGSSYIYGLEWRDTAWSNVLFDLQDTMGRNILYHTVPCALCMAEGRNGKIMIPGKFECPEGWIHEYDGYIMSGGHSDKHSSEYICVDKRPQVIPGTQGAKASGFLHLVETQCGALQCEPLVLGREIRCVVCTI